MPNGAVPFIQYLDPLDEINLLYDFRIILIWKSLIYSLASLFPVFQGENVIQENNNRKRPMLREQREDVSSRRTGRRKGGESGWRLYQRRLALRGGH
jgi:hypothetical protein